VFVSLHFSIRWKLGEKFMKAKEENAPGVLKPIGVFYEYNKIKNLVGE